MQVTLSPQSQGDRTILTRLPFLAHRVCYVPAPRLRTSGVEPQTHSPRHGCTYTPARWGGLPGVPWGPRACVPGSSPAALAAVLLVLAQGSSMVRMVRSPCHQRFVVLCTVTTGTPSGKIEEKRKSGKVPKGGVVAIFQNLDASDRGTAALILTQLSCARVPYAHATA